MTVRNRLALIAVAGLAACGGERTPSGDPNPEPDPDNTNPVYAITITPPAASVAVNGRVQFAAQLRDAAGDPIVRPVTWTSDDEAVATVSADGSVEGVGAGSTLIRAASEGKEASVGVTVTAVGRVGFHVAPSGSSGGDGSLEQPWDLVSALAGGGGRIQPGDTVWLHGGTYRGFFRSTLTGTASNPVVVRQYPGERAILDAAASGGGSTLNVRGAYSVFWGFEISNSNPVRSASQTGSDYRPHGITNYASHTKYINLTVHDAGVAFYTEASYGDVEMTGCVFYNHGWQGPNRGAGHAMYLKSNAGPVLMRENIVFNQYGYGIHAYSNAGSGEINNMRFEGNILFNNGTLSSNSTASNILLGGAASSTGGVVRGNFTYSSPGVNNRNVQIGYESTQNGSVQVLDNYVVGGATGLDIGYWSSLVATGNRLIGASTGVSIHDSRWPLTMFSGQVLPSLPAATRVVVQKNPYETGRANIVVYNWSKLSAVDVELAGIVPLGARYEIRNVQDLYGTPVVSGVYAGGDVSLPIRGVTPPVPIGLSSSRAPATGIDFNAYIVTMR